MTIQGGDMSPLPDAHLVATGQGFKVRPGVARVRRADGFYFRNLTESWVLLQFPDEVTTPNRDLEAQLEFLRKLFPEGVVNLLVRSSKWVAPKPENAPAPTVHFDIGLAADGYYEYTATVYTKAGPVNADGDSSPKIIVDP